MPMNQKRSIRAPTVREWVFPPFDTPPATHSLTVGARDGTLNKFTALRAISRGLSYTRSQETAASRFGGVLAFT